ncbi:MAG: SDR family oxidoreductase [Proteobacteria bacterium]|nr:SDR family oxidoreductase [Pseudomonadota bacterium]
MTMDYQNTSFNLHGKVALVTGAGGYLGSQMAVFLGVAGAHVILNGRHSESLQKVQQQLSAQNIESTLLCFDITDEEAVTENLKTIGNHFTCLDILVNNAHSGRACAYQDAQREDFFRDFNVDVVATFELIKKSVPLLKKAVSLRQDASVINIASMYGMVSPDPSIYGDSKMNNPPHYGVAKAGLIQLTKYMACHLAQDKIRVNAISPGPFPAEEVINKLPEFKEKLIQKVPLARIGKPHELLGPLLLLASSASSFMTGVNIPVDGGWTAW